MSLWTLLIRLLNRIRGHIDESENSTSDTENADSSSNGDGSNMENEQPHNTDTMTALSIGTGPYENNLENIIDELKLADILVQAEVERWRSQEDRPPEDRGLPYVSDGEADNIRRAALLGLGNHEWRSIVGPYMRAFRIIRERVGERIEQTQENILRLRRLGQIFELDQNQMNLILLCLAPEMDTNYRKLYAYLQDDGTRQYPSAGLVIRMAYWNPAIAETNDPEDVTRTVVSGYSALAANATLRQYGILEVRDDAIHLSEQEVRLSESVTRYLTSSELIGIPDEHSFGNLLSDCCNVYRPETSWEEVVVPAPLKDQLQDLPQALSSGKPYILLQGPTGAGQREAVEAVAVALSLNVLSVDAGQCSERQEIGKILEVASLEALLQNAMLYLRGVDIDDPEGMPSKDITRALVSLSNKFKGIHILESENGLRGHTGLRQPDYLFKFTLPDFILRLNLWEKQLTSIDLNLDSESVRTLAYLSSSNGTSSQDQKLNAVARDLANQFTLTGDQIREAVSIAVNMAPLTDSANPRPTFDHLRDAARRVAGQKLIHFTRKLEPSHSWDQLIVPVATKSHLIELKNRIQFRNKLFFDAGFLRGQRGGALTVFFTGSSGTGKTMAAEVLAGRTNMDLYQIDLAAVVSKYIGETEKNLDRIFQDAESSNAILFFDEADALFGKRSEVSDAHDRYANIEINYLLQRMEAFDGVVILASNLRQNMDNAFLRRIQIIVEFPFPDASARKQIWLGMFPSHADLACINFTDISERFKLAGGSIRNIAEETVFRAYRDDSPGTLKVKKKHLIRAIGREYQKIGRPITRGEFGSEDYDRLAKYLYDGTPVNN